MIAGKNLNHVDIANPSRENLEIILDLLDEKIKKSGNNGTYVIAQEFHPEGGYANGIVTLKFAQSQYGQRQSAPFVLCYFPREYYQNLLNNCPSKSV